MKDANLFYYADRSILVCRSKAQQKMWAKKIYDIESIYNALEDNGKFYLSCDSGEKSGQFLAIHKKTGSTAWFIPGKTFLQILFEKFLYLIFVDENDCYFLLKVNQSKGETLWHHKVKEDLKEYAINKNRVKLVYSSGMIEILSSASGKPEAISQ